MEKRCKLSSQHKKRRLKKKFVVFFSLYLVLLTSLFVINTYSKYTGSITKTGDTSVAKWDVSSNIPDATLNLVPSGEDSYSLTITNNSEVSAKYSIVVSNIPSGTLVSLDNGAYKAYSSTVSFNNIGTIKTNAATKTKSHTINFKTIPEASAVSNRNIKIQVNFEQTKPQ